MSRIPWVFHFVFGLRPQTQPFHLVHYLALRSCLEVNQPDRLVLHLGEEPWGPWWDRIRPDIEVRRVQPDAWLSEYRYTDEEIARYRYAHLSDLVRLDVLVAEGGIYADIDTLFVRRPPDSLLEHEFVLGRERPPAEAGAEGSLCNAWIGAAPGSRFAREWRDSTRAAFDGSWSAHSTLLPARLAQQLPDHVHIEPEESFYALDWSPEALADLFEREVELPGGCYSLHLWEHLWFDETRTDFSRFSGRALTPDYVEHARTTYAVAARRHLPDDLRTHSWALAAQRAAVLGRRVGRRVRRSVT